MNNDQTADSERTLNAINTLGMMIDYCIIEGAQLRLPLFVRLLRMARLELSNSTDEVQVN